MSQSDNCFLHLKSAMIPDVAGQSDHRISMANKLQSVSQSVSQSPLNLSIIFIFLDFITKPGRGRH